MNSTLFWHPRWNTIVVVCINIRIVWHTNQAYIDTSIYIVYSMCARTHIVPLIDSQRLLYFHNTIWQLAFRGVEGVLLMLTALPPPPSHPPSSAFAIELSLRKLFSQPYRRLWINVLPLICMSARIQKEVSGYGAREILLICIRVTIKWATWRALSKIVLLAHFHVWCSRLSENQYNNVPKSDERCLMWLRLTHIWCSLNRLWDWRETCDDGKVIDGEKYVTWRRNKCHIQFCFFHLTPIRRTIHSFAKTTREFTVTVLTFACRQFRWQEKKQEWRCCVCEFACM